MCMEAKNIRNYLQPGKRAHLVGIGGVSMASLAEVLHGAGVAVTGSDQRESATVLHLRKLGIEVVIGHLPESVQGADCVVRTAAVHDGNPEIAAALKGGIPVFERAQAWGAIMQGYKNALCISGTHGKTTTTSMCTHIFMAAQADPTVMIGGTLPLLEAGHRVGRGETIILESCEYCDSFLSFYPTVAVILNVEADHLDYFKDLADVEKSFRAFADKVPENGLIIANCEDENTMFTLRGEERDVMTFGVDKGDVHAENLSMDHGFGSFDVMCRGKKYAHLDLSVPGMHNVKNAIAAAAAAIGAGLADLLTAPMWVLPTLVIKAVLVLFFTSKSECILCPRNWAAVVAAGLFSPAAYALANCVMAGTMTAFLPQFLGTLAQGIGSGALFLVIAPALDGVKLKEHVGA